MAAQELYGRQIIFRAKRLDDGELVYGAYLQVEDKHYIVTGPYKSYVADDDFLMMFTTVPVDPATVGQFIGMTDKQLKPVFEGDIVEVKGHYPGVVRFDAGEYYLYRNGKFSGFRDQIPEYGLVIGNIYDNPELMKPVPGEEEE